MFCVNRYAFTVTGNMLKFYYTGNKSIKSVICAASDIIAGMYMRPALSYDYIACKNCLTVSAFYAQSFRLAVAAVPCRTDAFFMCKKL